LQNAIPQNKLKCTVYWFDICNATVLCVTASKNHTVPFLGMWKDNGWDTRDSATATDNE